MSRTAIENSRGDNFRDRKYVKKAFVRKIIKKMAASSRVKLYSFLFRLLKKQVSSIPKVLSSSTAGGKKEQIDVLSLIPRRINRSPTDILKALSNTVGRDPTAFHYQIPDDPLFYPLSNYQKKKRLLSLESGKKSARWIVENNPKLFDANLAEPPIKAFLNKLSFDENSEVTEEVLLGLIQERNVSQAITVYNLLQNKGTDVSKDARQSLLELVCFYNSKDKPNEKDVWGKWYNMVKEKQNIWRDDDNFVKKLFDSLEPESPLAYAAIIQGMLKHENLEEAMELFAAGKEKKIKFPVGVYNLILEKISFLEKDPFGRLRAIEDYLREMVQGNVKPNLGTLNSILNALSKMDEIPFLKKYSFISKLLGDFETIKIHPSLGSYYYLIKIVVDQKDVIEIRHEMSWTIMDAVRRKSWTIQHPSDVMFFNTSMVIFCTVLRSWKLVQALMNFYLSDDHREFLSSNAAENMFFEYYISMAFANEPVENSMEIYRELVPSQTILEIRRYWVIVRAIIQQKKFEYLEEIWKDIKCYSTSEVISRNSNILSHILTSVSSLKKEETPRFFYEIAEVLFKLLDTAEFSPLDLMNMAITFARFEDEEKASAVVKFIIDVELLFTETSPVKEIFAFALSKKNIPLIKDCLELCHRQNDPELSTKAKEALPLLDEESQNWVNETLKKSKGEKKKRKVEKQEINPEGA